jgi:hypothetical protein
MIILTVLLLLLLWFALGILGEYIWYLYCEREYPDLANRMYDNVADVPVSLLGGGIYLLATLCFICVVKK